MKMTRISLILELLIFFPQVAKSQTILSHLWRASGKAITIHLVLCSYRFHWYGFHSCGVSKSPEIFASCGFYVLIPQLMHFLIFFDQSSTNDFTHANLVHVDFFQTQKMHEPRAGRRTPERRPNGLTLHGFLVALLPN